MDDYLVEKECFMSARWLLSDLDQLWVDQEPLELGSMEVDEFFAELIELIRQREKQGDPGC